MRDIAVLLKLIRAGQKEAFSELYRGYWDRLYRAAKYKVRDHEDAVHIVQELFCTLWAKRGNIPDTANELYIGAILRYNCIDLVRTNIVKQNSLKELQQQKLTFTDPISLENKELSAQIRAAFNKLPPQTKQICELFLIEDLSAREISGKLGVPIQSVKNGVLFGKHLLISKIKAEIEGGADGNPTAAENNELATGISADIEALPQKMQMVYKLRIIDKMSIKDIVCQLKISRFTVYNQLKNARVRIQSKSARGLKL